MLETNNQIVGRVQNINEINLSIIIPHYNTPKLLEKLLKSIPEKEDIQIIVVDDNSQIELGEYNQVVEAYSCRAEFYKNDSGIQSAGACRNIGLKHAKGIWVMFADADDFFLPQMYESVSSYFQTDYEMVIFCPTSIFIDTGELADRHIPDEIRIKRYLENPTYKNLLTAKSMKGPWAKIIRRSVIIDNNIFFSETLHCNDTYFVFKTAYYCKKTAVSGDVIYCITRNSGSLTTRVNEQAYDLRIQEFMKCYKFGMEHYSKDEFDQFNLNGGIFLFDAYKRNFGMKKILHTWKIMKKNNIPLLSRQMRNPVYLIKAIIMNNKMINREKKYYIGK